MNWYHLEIGEPNGACGVWILTSSPGGCWRYEIVRLKDCCLKCYLRILNEVRGGTSSINILGDSLYICSTSSTIKVN